jgi:ATP-dependent Lon protease
MDNRFYLQGGEDEMEFLPIIPLNEDDDGSADEQPIPDEIPIGFENGVLFQVLYFYYRRPG